MSYELKIDPKTRAAGRFIGQVRKSLVLAAIDEKTETGISQREIASRLGVNRSVINRLLRGESNLTLRSVAEIAWALGWEPVFTLRRRKRIAREHNHLVAAHPHRQILKSATSSTFGNSVPTSSTSTLPVNIMESAG